MSSIQEIAKAAKCHKCTVSRVLANKKHVNIKTREKILKIAEELNYTPNILAKGLTLKKTSIIGILASIAKEVSFLPEIYSGIESVTLAKGYKNILCDSMGKEERSLQQLKLLKELKVDGIICLIQGEYNFLEKIRAAIGELPYVTACSSIRSGEFKGDSVHWNFAAGVRMIIEHFAKCGYRRIAHITTKEGIGFAAEKKSAFIREMKRLNLEFSEDMIVKNEESVAGAYEAMMSLLKRETRIDAVFATNDMTAIGAINAIRDSGKRVPEDIAVAGYDNFHFLFPFTPVPLTTIESGKQELGRHACELLLDRIENPEKKIETHFIEPSLIIRKSTLKNNDMEAE